MAVTIGDHKGLVRDLKRQGWVVDQTNRGHYKAVPPNGKPLVHFSTSSDPHAWRNSIKQLEDSGYKTQGAERGGKGTSATTTCPACGGAFDEVKAECLGECSVTEPADMDALWSALKDAKELHAVAKEDLSRAYVGLQEAKRLVELAEKELGDRTVALRKAKQRFDKEFGG